MSWTAANVTIECVVCLKEETIVNLIPYCERQEYTRSLYVCLDCWRWNKTPRVVPIPLMELETE